MISTQKRVVYGAVLAGSLGLLVTQIVARHQTDGGPPPLDLPAEGAPVVLTASALDSVAIDAPDTGSPSVPERTSEPPTPQPEIDSVLAKLERSLGTLRNFQPGTLRPELAQLTGTPSAGGEARSAPGGSDAEALLHAASEARASVQSRAELDALLEAQPLCGIIAGQRDAAALFGGRIVRVGDHLLPGQALVRAIEPKAVVIAFGDDEVRIEMPPLRPRPKPVVSDEDDASTEEPELEVAPTVEAPPSTAATSTANAPETNHAAKQAKQPE